MTTFLYKIKYSCILIILTFSDYYSLNCSKCGRKYKHKSTLYSHLKYECGVAPKFQCSICNKMFKHKSQLKCHLIAIHKIIVQ